MSDMPTRTRFAAPRPAPLDAPLPEAPLKAALRPARAFAAAMPVFAALALAACTGGGVDSTLGTARLDGGAPAPVAEAKPEVQDPRAYCPKTVLRAGTETFNLYPDKMKKDDPDARQKLRFRATITDVVRECNYAGNTLNIKVGVAGRLLSGPSGESGQFLMPIRIVVTQGENVLYSVLHDAPAEIPAGRTNNTFAFVDSAVSIPKPENASVLIYAGFDEQRTDSPGDKNAARGGNPRNLPKVN